MIGEESEAFNPLPTLRQVHSELTESYCQLDQAFKDIGIVPLQINDDLQSRKITLKKILASIPREQQLVKLKQEVTKNIAKQTVANYNGNNQLIRKAKVHYNELKRQQQTIYYLAAQCNLQSVSQQFKPKLDNSEVMKELQKLASYQITQQKKSKSKILEKNTLSDTYLQFEDNQAQLDKNENMVTIVKGYKKNPELKPLDLLIHINFYDCVNEQKLYQFVCLEQQWLKDVVDKFKCVVEVLTIAQKNKNSMINSKKINDECNRIQLYDKQQLSKLNSNNSNNTIRYLVIQDTIYYQGNKSQLQQYLSTAQQCLKYRYLQLQKTKLSDIRLIFGKPYLYRHLNGCDHIIIFKQARLFMGNNQASNYSFCNTNDITTVDKYPITVFENKMKRKKCQCCSQFFADAVVIGDRIKNGENLLVCDNCWKDIGVAEGDKVKIVPYVHD